LCLQKGEKLAGNRKKRFENPDFYRGAMRWMGVGIEFCLVIGIFAAGGYWLGRLENKPGTSTGGLIMGFFVGFGVMLYLMLKRAKKDEDERSKDESEQPQ
jgi:hypothetical protein